MEPSRPAPVQFEPRQRWRAVYRRRPDAPRLPQSEQLEAWERSLATSGLPLAGLELPVPRPRLVVAAPLAVGVAGERELADLYLVDRRAAAEVRVRLAGSLPAGHELVDVHDVWLGEPPLPGQVVAADYRVRLERPADADPAPDVGVARAALSAACARLLGGSELPWTRRKGVREISFDLRALIADVAVLTEDRLELDLRIRTRFDPVRGVGRPEDVVAALAELSALAIDVRSIVRERLYLAGETRPAGSVSI